MKRGTLPGWVSLFAVALLFAAGALAAGRAATVSGPERAFIRRGPGTEFQAYATVERGEQVQVEEVTGTWALVRTAGGQSGYVHAAYLFYANNQPVLVATPTAAPAAPQGAPAAAAAAPVTAPAVAAGATPEHAPEAVETGDLAQRNAELAAEVESLKRELDSLHKDPLAAPSPGDLVALRAEVRRLADITDALRSRLDAPAPGSSPLPIAGEEPWSTSMVIVLAGSALVLGWVIGGVLARREERSRRNRIRF